MFYPPNFKTFTLKRSIFNEKQMLQCKLHLMSQSKKIMVMDFFISCGIEGHVHNFGKPYFESSYYLR